MDRNPLVNYKDVTSMSNDPLFDLHSSSTKLNKDLTRMLKAQNKWDLKSMEKLIDVCEEDYSAVTRLWTSAREQVKNNIENTSVLVSDLQYGKEIEAALSETPIPVQGSYPEFSFPPFKLLIEPNQKEAKLLIGRKMIKIACLKPKEMVSQVLKHYQSITSRKLDSKKFLQDLLPAYEIANRLTYKEESVLWGRAVSLSRIYELFTMRKASRQEYPKELFQYDIGRMKEQFGLTLEQYRFELGFSRDQSKAMVIVDNQGRTQHLSSLTVYREESK